MITEARISALLVSLLTGAGLTVILANTFHNIEMALQVTIPATLIMGVILVLTASDTIKPRGGAAPPETTDKKTDQG